MWQKKNIIISAFRRIKGLMRKLSVLLWEFHRTFSLIAAAPKRLPKRSEAKSFKSRTQQIIWITHTLCERRKGLLANPEWASGLGFGSAGWGFHHKQADADAHSTRHSLSRGEWAWHSFFGHSSFCATSIIKMFGSSSFSSLCVSLFYLV